MRKFTFFTATLAIMFFIFSGVAMACSPPPDPKNVNTNTNTNVNCNKNKNINTNEQQQGQIQGQVQGQLQGQTQSNSVNNSDTLTITQGREFATPGNANYGSILYNAPHFDAYGVWNIKEICMYNNKFRLIDVVGSLIEEGMLMEATIDSEAYITVIFGKRPMVGLDRIGYMAVMATKEGSSLDALYWIMYRAYLMGGTTIHVVGEGVEKELKSSGWGIGFHGTKATINSDGDSSGVAGGGTGYSRAKAKEEVNPWIRAIVLR